MIRQTVDYSGFSLSRLSEPRFRHAWLLAGWIVYFALYFLTENLIPPERMHLVHCALDDRIPFTESFVIIYVAWYVFVLVSLSYTFFYDVEAFKKLQISIMITQAIAMLCYILYPTVQDLRPAVFPRDNVFTKVLGFIYAFDTPTGVCPSLHVGYSLCILSMAVRDREQGKWAKAGVIAFVILVCLSVCFVKQHSFLDVLAALPVWLIADGLVYGTGKRRNNQTQIRPGTEDYDKETIHKTP